jgi:RNase P/RNase MRP subunit POP5
MKTTPKTLRPDHRYLKIKMDADESRNFSEAVKLVKSAIKAFSGEKGLAKTDTLKNR